jgi:glycosyltransferase involved in cell wall biosynthesis
MKICLFADARSVHVHQLARRLLKRGHTVHVLSHKVGEIPGVTVDRFRVPAPSLTNPRRWQGRWSQYLRGFLQRFDVINVHFLIDWGFTPELMEKGCVVATAWGSDVVAPPGEDAPTAELSEARKAMIQHAAMATACGPTFARVVAEFGAIPVGSMEVVPFGVDLGVFRRPKHRAVAIAARPRDSESLRVGYFKGFREVYGATHWVRAMPAVRAELPNVTFDMVGDGPQLQLCQSLARDLGVDDAIRWLPRAPHYEVPDLLAGWNLSVIPSEFEAFGVAALESSAMGVPVVAANVGGLQDTVIHGRTGILVDPRSPEALARAVVRLLRDGPLRESMRREGEAFVAGNFGWEAVARRWEQAYEKARERISVMT